MNRFFIYMKDLEALILIYKSQSHYIYLLYLFINYFNRMKKLDIYRQTASSLRYKARKYLKRFT